MSSALHQTGLDDVQDCLLTPESRTDLPSEADLRELRQLPELRKRYVVEGELFCNPEHPLSKKAEQLGFRRVELMQPHLVRGKEIPQDLEDWGKRMWSWMCLSVKIHRLEALKKDLKAQAHKRASKSLYHSGMWSEMTAVGKKAWGSLFS
ncbi:hypothetical protein COCOBI_04-4810 [Coccomyxa sp. Obi]|nr:hypothetical protein COCOBI_04-4810 [Coccomyxa sp. Obi]